jgi:hypothetical protein
MANENDATPLTGRERLVFARMVCGASLKGLRRQSELLRQDQEYIQERRKSLRAIGSLVGLVIESAGFRRYRRGPWKKRRMKALSDPNMSQDASQQQRLALAIRQLAKALVAGDDSALAPLQRLRRLHPAAFAGEIAWNLTDLAHHALAVDYAGANNKRYTDFRVHLKLEADKLAGDNPSPAMQCAGSWVAIMQAHASVEAAKVATERKSGALLAPVSKAYLHAVKTLAQIEAIETRRARRVRPKARAVDATFKVIQ